MADWLDAERDGTYSVGPGTGSLRTAVDDVDDADGNICYIGAAPGYLEVATFRFTLDQAGEFLRAAITAYHQAFTQQTDAP